MENTPEKPIKLKDTNSSVHELLEIDNTINLQETPNRFDAFNKARILLGETTYEGPYG